MLLKLNTYKYLSGNNFARIGLIRGKLSPDRYFTPYSRLLISTAFVVSRVGCPGVTGVIAGVSEVCKIEFQIRVNKVIVLFYIIRR